MKFQIEKTLDNAKKNWERFPFVMLSATATYIFSILLAEIIFDTSIKETTDKARILLNYGYLIYLSGLSLVLTFAGTLFIERKKINGFSQNIPHLVLIIVLVGLFFTFPTEMNFILALKFFLWALSAHLLAAFLPFYQKDENFGFWSYNQIIFGRFLLSAVFSGVLFIGISLGLTAIQILFQISINTKIYIHLFLMCAYLHTWFFLSEIPTDFDALNEKIDYNQSIGILTKYILLPLTSLYMLILYAYSIRILIDMTLPKGWVVYLIVAFSIAGIFALLMIYPLQNEKNEGWINIFTRTFYIALMPLLVLLFISIGVRISQYGFTENRYYVVLLGVWLLGMCVHYAIFRRYDQIKIIPLSLCLMFFLSSFGPWSAFSVAEYSQKSRLYSLLAKNKGLNTAQKIIPISNVNTKDKEKIRDIISFLGDRGSIDEINQRLEKPINFTKKLSQNEKESKVLVFLQLDYKRESMVKDEKYEEIGDKKEIEENNKIINFKNESSSPFYNTKGYDYFVVYKKIDYGSIDISSLKTNIFVNEKNKLVFTIRDEKFVFNLDEEIEKNIDKLAETNEENVIILLKKNNLKVKLDINLCSYLINEKIKKLKRIDQFEAGVSWKIE